jgi:L-ascorbate metabolism protein UlaG (beta-lactamase superfamily)
VRLTLVRHATLVIEAAGRRLMVDPMLDAAGARGPVRGTPDERPNPLVDLPMPAAEAAAGVEAVLLTHTHVDHFDAAGVTTVPAGVPWFCQPEDMADLQQTGLQGSPAPLGEAVTWEGLSITRTGGRHGRTEEMVRALAPVSGYVVRADGEPTLYVAGDTVWCEEVADALAAHEPDVIVVNAGAATFLSGGTVTMEAADVAAVAGAAPEARIVAVHMEAINHCVATRADLAAAAADAGIGLRVLIPSDGDALTL